MVENPLQNFWSCNNKNSKDNIIIPLWPSYYMPQKTQNTIIQTSLKHYNKYRSVSTEALRWLKIVTDALIKLKVETTVK